MKLFYRKSPAILFHFKISLLYIFLNKTIFSQCVFMTCICFLCQPPGGARKTFFPGFEQEVVRIPAPQHSGNNLRLHIKATQTAVAEVQKCSCIMLKFLRWRFVRRYTEYVYEFLSEFAHARLFLASTLVNGFPSSTNPTSFYTMEGIKLYSQIVVQRLKQLQQSLLSVAQT